MHPPGSIFQDATPVEAGAHFTGGEPLGDLVTRPATGAVGLPAGSLGYLSFERLHCLHATAVERGLGGEAAQRALIAGLPPAVVASLPQAPTAGTRILKTLVYLNGIQAFSNGVIPLQIWLRNAEKLLARVPEQEVVRTALEELRVASEEAARGDLALGAAAHLHRLDGLAAPSRAAGGGFKPAYNDSSTKVLSRKLERLYAVAAGQEQGLPGAARRYFSEEIDRVTRRLREGGQLQPGDFLAGGRFQLLSCLGEGSWAAVWKVRDQGTGEMAAAKVLHSRHGHQERIRRFLRGARSMRKLSHPHIVQIKLENGAGEFNSTCFFYYFVMELLAGGDLRTARLSQAVDRERGLAVIGQVAQALQFAHDHQVVHGHVSPENILFREDGTAKLTDFDLLLEQDVLSAARAERNVVFLAPEAADGQATASSDVYSLAMTAVFVMYGKPLAQGVLLERSAFFSSLPCSESVRRVLMKATDRHAPRRFQSVEELWQALSRACRQKPGMNPPRSLGTPDTPSRLTSPRVDTHPPSHWLGTRTAAAAMGIAAALALAFPIRTLLFAAHAPITPIAGTEQGAPAVPSAGHSREAAAGAKKNQLADAGIGQADIGARTGDQPERSLSVPGR